MSVLSEVVDGQSSSSSSSSMKKRSSNVRTFAAQKKLEAESANATLRSIMQRVSPSPAKEDVDMSVRKTPFGVVRIPSGTQPRSQHHEQQACRRPPNESDDCCSNLPPVRQRTRQGRAELRADGLLLFTHATSRRTVFITADLQRVAMSDDDEHQRQSNTTTKFQRIDALSSSSPISFLVDMAMAWLARYRRKVILAVLMIRNRSSTGVMVERDCVKQVGQTICQLYANGPTPDFEMRTAYGTVFPITINVRVSRSLHRITVMTNVNPARESGQPWSVRRVHLPLVGANGCELCLGPVTLSKEEDWAVQMALSFASDADNLFALLQHA